MRTPALITALLVVAVGVADAIASANETSGQITFVATEISRPATGDAYFIRSDGTGLRRIAHDVGDAVPSPNGDEIAVWGYCARSGAAVRVGVCVVGTHQGRPRLVLTEDTCADPTGIAWSPDGSRLAVACHVVPRLPIPGVPPVVRGQLVHVFLLRPSSPSARRVIYRTHGRAATVGGLAWSPDGSRLAFYRTGFKRGSNLTGELDFVRPDGSGLRHVASVNDFAADGFTTSWAPDGRLAFQRDETSFVVLTPAGTVAWTDNGFDPSFSPDGRWIAFLRGHAPYVSAYVSGDGRHRHATRVFTTFSPPAWAPDSRELAAPASCESRRGLCILIVTPNGRRLRLLRLGSHLAAPDELAWRSG